MKNARVLQQIATLCKQWGGELRLLKHGEPVCACHLTRDPHAIFDRHICGYSEAPFASYPLAVHWKKKIIAVDVEQVHIGSLIHELAHVFASRKLPRFADEFPFLGWEITVARKLRSVKSWVEHMQDYCIDPDTLTDWPDLSRKQQRELVRERVAYAKAHKLLDASGNPRAIR